MSQASSSYGGRVKRVLCPNCHVLANRLEAVSIISGRMKSWTLECRHLMPLLQFMLFPYRQW
uniref:Uncharacterized protein n=1 Tax=Oryza punctata TaxID=4537 RepID=A0A0E0LPK1_ORYPU